MQLNASAIHIKWTVEVQWWVKKMAGGVGGCVEVEICAQFIENPSERS